MKLKQTQIDKQGEDISDEVHQAFEHITPRINAKKFKKYKLDAEVIVYALKAMKEYPTLTIAQAFEIGCQEWDV